MKYTKGSNTATKETAVRDMQDIENVQVSDNR